MSTVTDLEPRTYFSTLDNALADFGASYQAIPQILEAVRDLDVAHVYIPESRQHVGLEGSDGGDPVAYIFPTFVALHPRDGVSSFVELPRDAEDHAPVPVTTHVKRSSAGRAAPVAPAAPAMCGRCFVVLPASGRCDFCD